MIHCEKHSTYSTKCRKCGNAVQRERYRTLPEVRAMKMWNWHRRYWDNESFRLSSCIRSRIRSAFRSRGLRKSKSTAGYGIDIDAIMSKVGPKPSPSHHLDHFIPVALCDHADPEQVRLCWSPENLRWLEGRENMSKSDSLPPIDLCPSSLVPLWESAWRNYGARYL